MRKLVAICVVVALTLLGPGAADAGILTVGPGQTYTTIQAGVNAAISGDTINVLAGTYSTNPTHTQGVVHVDKSLTIQGSGPGTKTVDGGDPFAGGFWTGFNVVADNVTIKGLSVIGTAGQGFYLDSSSNAVIEDNVVSGWGTGIRLVGNFGSYGDNVVRNNSVYDNLLGITINVAGGLTAADNLFQGNTIYNNTNGIGIEASYGGVMDSLTVSGNTLYDHSSSTIFSRTWRWPSRVDPNPWGTFSDISITGNFITGNRGVTIGYAYDPDVGYVSGESDVTGFHINYNNIVGNTDWLAKNVGTGALDVTHNWWGSPTPDPALIQGAADYSSPLSNPIPEPATFTIWALLACLGIVGPWWRRRRKAA